ncbi:MAG: ABC transporter ATP-binding protein [Verrucomicrobiales bacterium]|nr:ABC transporter ATP-binding protein [Verrucomicrobiales bacterium]
MIESAPLLSYREVTRRFSQQNNPAVNGVSLDVNDGEILALIGESGSGKTTLLRLAAGLESPDGGEVLLGGEVVAGGNGREVPPEKRRLGLMFQDGALFPHLKAEKNVAYGLRGWEPDRIRARVSECLRMVDLEGKESRFPHELSGGERQRLALARALAPEPQLLLLDEPFSHLDPSLRRKLREEIRRILVDLGQTALLVTHDPEDALAIASRVAILDRGKVIQVGSPSEVYQAPADQYCAERFGPANKVRNAETGEVTWTRPEDARWISCEVAEEGSMATVADVRPMGTVYEVSVVPDDDPDERWLCFFKEGEQLKVGDRGRVAWRGKPDKVAWKS